MRCFKPVFTIITLAALSALAMAQAPIDRGKFFVERPLKQLIAVDAKPEAVAPPPVAAVGDVTKRLVIELPVEELVKSDTSPAAEHANADNPRVEPGKVKWHENFAAACEAGERTGKPVLLFHLMGQLDQKFT